MNFIILSICFVVMSMITCGNALTREERRSLMLKKGRAQECSDEYSSCSNYTELCIRQDIIGDSIRTVCRKTCGICVSIPTLSLEGTFHLHVGGCGKPHIRRFRRVIAGKTAVPHRWPWQILTSYDGSPICGGTLIAPQWVVTAAHCIVLPFMKRKNGTFSIRVGEHDLFTIEGSEVDIKVTKVLVHERYNQPIYDNDIAMFKLEYPVKFNEYVSPICLPKANIPVGSKCYVTGWGDTYFPGNYPKNMTRFLQQGILPVVTNEKCYEKNYPHNSQPILDNMICGGSGGTERTIACLGDSGGPLGCKVDGVWELHGSASYASPVCNPNDVYTVFSRTFYFLNWIKKNMERH